MIFNPRIMKKIKVNGQEVSPYQGRRLLTSSDADGNVPEIFMCVSDIKNRSVGKTTYFATTLLDNFFDRGEKFVLICRTGSSLGSLADGILKNALNLFYKGWYVSEVVGNDEYFSDIYLINGIGEDKEKLHCGYCIPLNRSDSIKQISSKFVDATCAFFDEFMPAGGRYLPKETSHLVSLHTSLSRGEGQPVRYFPFIMSSNVMDMYNPYYALFNLTGNIQPDTLFYKGHGVVFQQTKNEVIASARAQSGFARAIGDLSEGEVSSEECNRLVEKPNKWGTGIYQFGLDDEDKKYGVYYYPEVGIIYISYGHDNTQRTYRVVMDGRPNSYLIRNTRGLKIMKSQFAEGVVRFQTPQIKRMFTSTVLNIRA